MTGATDADIEAALRSRWAVYSDLDYDQAKAHDLRALDMFRDEADFWAPHFVPPGKVITNAAALPSPEVIAAMREMRELFDYLQRMVRFHLGDQSFDVPECVGVVDAYLAAIEGDGT